MNIPPTEVTHPDGMRAALPDEVKTAKDVFTWLKETMELWGMNPDWEYVREVATELRQMRADSIREATARERRPKRRTARGKDGESFMASATSEEVEAHVAKAKELELAKRWPAYDMRQLREEGFTVRWLIKGWWPQGQHGMLAGAQKTLKSWISVFEALSVASGKPLFGKFEIVSPGPVLVLTGEGHRGLWWSWLVNAGKSYGLTDKQIDALPIRVIDSVGDMTGEGFQETLARELEEFSPAFVVIDPLYAYVSGEADAGNVFDMGSRLASASEATTKAGAALQINHHTRKTADRRPTLTDITQAGSREWVGSWLLVSHRERPNLDDQSFELHIATGGRLGYGGNWDLDIALGALDEDGVRHSGGVRWSIKPASETAELDEEERAAVKEVKAMEQRSAVAAKLRETGPATVKEFAPVLAVTEAVARKRLKDLVDEGLAEATSEGKAGTLRYAAVLHG